MKTYCAQPKCQRPSPALPTYHGPERNGWTGMQIGGEFCQIQRKSYIGLLLELYCSSMTSPTTCLIESCRVCHHIDVGSGQWLLYMLCIILDLDSIKSYHLIKFGTIH